MEIEEQLDREIVPRSRIYPLGTGELPKGMNQFEFMNLVYDCKMTKQMTHVLGYLAIRYNFTDRRATMMGQRRAANDLKMERKTFRQATKALEEWGWVRIKNGTMSKPDRYTLLIGREIADRKWTDEVAKRTQLQNEQDQADSNEESES